MEGNNFITKLKADGSQNDECSLDKVYDEYRSLLMKIQAKERGIFSLNVLCILCRNLDKVPSWRENIDNKYLLMLSIDCVRETRGMDKSIQVKTLACIYHLHKHVVRQKTLLSPEMILKLSMMAFESKELVKEHSKTYWNLILDRITYFEMIKDRISITKLLPKLMEDLLRVFDIYDTVHLVLNLNLMLKKLLYLFSGKSCAEFNVYTRIFDRISKKTDVDVLKKLHFKELLNLYVKFIDCLYMITESRSKDRFRNFELENVVRIMISLIGHSEEIFHCLQTYYLNALCCLFKDTNSSYVETILSNLLASFQTRKTSDSAKVMSVTYPYLSQFLNLYIEYAIKTKMSENLQVKILETVQYLAKELKNTEQLVRCENCHAKTGLHDALRILFQAKNVFTKSIEQKAELKTILPMFYGILKEQYAILTQLGEKCCANYARYFSKLQTDVHNTAILLNHAKSYTYSKKLFDVYLKNEILHFKSDVDMKNIARALYNKSICELDSKSYDDALTDAFLSQIFGQDLNTTKYMSLVMDIKSKAYKDGESDPGSDDLQLMTSVQACKVALEGGLYGNLKPFFTTLRFSEMLKHEYRSYASLWPSVVPIAGVWTCLLDLYQGKSESWILVENRQEVLDTLLETVLETPSVVRTVQSEPLSRVVIDLVSILEREVGGVDRRVAHATLLFLKSEFDFAEVNRSFKAEEQNMNPDDFRAIRTYQQEFACLRSATHAVEMWLGLLPKLNDVTKRSWLVHSLAIAQIYVQQLLRLGHLAHGLQLATVCCRIAHVTDDRVSFIRNAGAILYYVDSKMDAVQSLLAEASDKFGNIVKDEGSMDAAIVFVCDCAIYYTNCQLRSVAAKLVLRAQAYVRAAQDSMPHLNLDLAIGRLLEAQTRLCPDSGPNGLTSANMAQRHYLMAGNNATKWTVRRMRAITVKHHTVASSVRAVRLARALLAWRRARSGAGAALPAAGAHAQAHLFTLITNTWKCDDAQTEIDNRLKHILGLQPTNEPQPEVAKKCPDVVFTPRANVEAMRDCLLLKKTQGSPSLPCDTVQAFKMPEFLLHDARCRCYACQTPSCPAMTVRTFCLEASVYFRAKEFLIAENYFHGVFKVLNLCEARLKSVVNTYKCKFESYIVEYVGRSLFDELKEVNLQVLLEASYFELAKGRYDVVDRYIVNMHEILQELRTVDVYLSNDISNLMTASACKRRVVRSPAELGIENAFESLALSPVKIDIVKTPEGKRLPVDYQSHRIVVDEEEIPKKRRTVAKFNLDEVTEEKEVKVSGFKVPTLVVPKHVLEVATPVATPRIISTQPSQDTPPTLHTLPHSFHKRIPNSNVTPRPRPMLHKQTRLDDTPREFFTPTQTPEQFFTPMTSVKTYSKTDLRGNIVKNLEKELIEKENVKEVNLRREVRNLEECNKENTMEAKVNAKTEKEGEIRQARAGKRVTNVRSTVRDTKKDLNDGENEWSKEREGISLRKKKTLQRATSPGKLPTEKRQLRKPKINLK